jgi:hypothetical protein
MSHTPGPWKARLNEWSRYEIISPSGGVLAVISKWDDPSSPPPVEQTEANACLIKTAPELLAALELALTAIDAAANRCEMLNDNNFLGYVLTGDKIRAAIAKAKP